MNRKLASIQVIQDVQSIPNADRIEVVSVLGWKVVTRKGEFKVGDKCVYFELDSVIPRKNWSEFLFKKPEDTTYRLKSVRLKKQLSQGLVVPLSSFINTPLANWSILVEGHDVTDVLGITKFEPPISASLAGEVKGVFPSMISKTDEMRIQSYPELMGEFKGKEVYITQKIDGSSSTFSCIKGEIDVCSRNLSLKETAGNTFWEMNRKYGITDKLLDIYNRTGQNYAVQGETYGEGIQQNRLGIKGHDLAVFTVYDIDNGVRLGYKDFTDFCETLGLPIVPILYVGEFKWNTVDEMIELARGKYPSGKFQEGIVVRPVVSFRSGILDSWASFKVINNEHLEHDEE